MSYQNQWKQYWDKKRNESKVGRVEIKSTSSLGRFHVISPHDEKFVEGAKELGGRWRYRSMVWSFDASKRLKVQSLLIKVYGKIDHGALY